MVYAGLVCADQLLRFAFCLLFAVFPVWVWGFSLVSVLVSWFISLLICLLLLVCGSCEL